MTKSEFGYFCAGVAAGALGHKFYPEMKDKLTPYMAGAMVFAQQAFGNAIRDAMQTAETMQQNGDSVGADFFKAAAGADAAANSDTAAA